MKSKHIIGIIGLSAIFVKSNLSIQNFKPDITVSAGKDENVFEGEVLVLKGSENCTNCQEINIIEKKYIWYKDDVKMTTEKLEYDFYIPIVGSKTEYTFKFEIYLHWKKGDQERWDRWSDTLTVTAQPTPSLF